MKAKDVILETLRKYPRSTPSAIRHLGQLTVAASHSAISRLRDRGQIHVAAWTVQNRRQTPMYSLGPGEAPEYVVKTATERDRIYRERKKRRVPTITSGPFAGL